MIVWKFCEYFNFKDQYQSLFSGVVRYSSIHPLSFKPLMLCNLYQYDVDFVDKDYAEICDHSLFTWQFR